MMKVVLGGMSAVLAESLCDMMGSSSDIEVVHCTHESEAAFFAARRHHADVLIVQGDRAPDRLAGLIEDEPLGLLLIDRDGHNGAVARISAGRRISGISREALVDAVHAVGGQEDV